MRILLVEDEAELASTLQSALSRKGFVLDRVATLEDARYALREGVYRAVLLDRRLPDGDGVELLATLARMTAPPPAILLTARSSTGEKVEGLDAGAQDYLAKPFDLDELLARLRAVLRRQPAPAQETIEVGNLRFDPVNREAVVAGRPLVLPRRELMMLELLVQRAGRIVQRATIEAALFGFDDAPTSNTIDSHVSRLRRRLGEAGATATVHALRGIGYVLKA
ncbi:DNA-binding response regulator [Allostella vacuolata]|nr:DNA-binding response regulator [Stella vacuolata]